MRLLLRTGWLLVAAGCTFVGPSTRKFERMARQPGGADVEVDLGKERPFVSGELLEVGDTALLVRDSHGGAITLIPFRLVEWGHVPDRGTTWQGRPAGGTRDLLRLLSR